MSQSITLIALTSGDLLAIGTAPTACGTPRASERQSTRASERVLARYAEGTIADNSGDTPSLTTYEWIDLYALTVRASEIDLEIDLGGDL